MGIISLIKCWAGCNVLDGDARHTVGTFKKMPAAAINVVCVTKIPREDLPRVMEPHSSSLSLTNHSLSCCNSHLSPSLPLSHQVSIRSTVLPEEAELSGLCLCHH